MVVVRRREAAQGTYIDSGVERAIAQEVPEGSVQRQLQGAEGRTETGEPGDGQVQG